MEQAVHLTAMYQKEQGPEGVGCGGSCCICAHAVSPGCIYGCYYTNESLNCDAYTPVTVDGWLLPVCASSQHLTLADVVDGYCSSGLV